MTWPDNHQMRGYLDEIRAACDDLQLGILDRDSEAKSTKRGEVTIFGLVDQAKRRVRDSMPTTSGGGGTPASVLDDEGDPMPPLSDPTGESAIANVDPESDRFRRNALDALEYLRSAVVDLRAAVTTLSKAEPHDDKPSGEPGCRSCRRLGRWSSVHRSERCRWCYDWWLFWKGDPPKKILEAYHEGRRVNSKLIEQIMGKGALRAMGQRSA